MKYGLTFMALTAIASAVAWSGESWLVRLSAGWSAISFGMVTVAYLGVGPRLLLKRDEGRRPWWAWLPLGPYFVLNGLGLDLGRLIYAHPFDEVVPGLFLGRRLSGREVRRSGIAFDAVLDLAAEFSEVASLRRLPAYRSLPILDATAPSPAELYDAVSWTTGRLVKGPVLVHCAMGHGRSATVVVAYLVATGRATSVEEGLAMVRASRPAVSLNAEQLAAVRGMATT